MEKIKVLHFIDKMDKGGAETLIMNVFRNIDRKNIVFDFAVSTSKECDYNEEIMDLGGSIHYIKRPNNLTSLFIFTRKMMKIIRNGKYNVVHSHVHFFSGYIALISKMCGVDTIITHSHTSNDGKKDNTFRKLYRKSMRSLILSFSDFLFTCSKEASLNLYGSFSFDNLVTIKNGIELNKFVNLIKDKNEVLEELSIPSDAFVIGHVGRFVEVKNHKFLIEVFNRIVEMNSNCYLILVGEGSLEEYIKGYVNELRITEKVKFLGVRSDIPEIMNSFDCFILPSLFEGLPTVLIEAQSIGLPCYVSDTVSFDADLGLGNYTRLSLQQTNQIWAETILKNDNKKLDNGDELIKNNGYSIIDIAKEIEKYYCKDSINKEAHN